MVIGLDDRHITPSPAIGYGPGLAMLEILKRAGLRPLGLRAESKGFEVFKYNESYKLNYLIIILKFPKMFFESNYRKKYF